MSKTGFKVNLGALKFTPGGPNDKFQENMMKAPDIAEHMRQFANNDGGVLYIGVKSDGTPVGLTATKPFHDWKDRIRALVNEAGDLLYPKNIVYNLYFDVVSIDSPKSLISPRLRPRSSSSPRIKSSLRIFVRICVDASSTKYLYLNNTEKNKIPINESCTGCL